jgi:energy-converting hydrogenase Eha subunit B
VTYSFSGGLILTLVVMTVLIALPVKIAAHLAGAQRTGLLWCGAAVAVGLFMGSLVSWIVGGLIGGPLAGLLGFVLGIRLMLGTTFAAAIGLSVIAFVLSIVGLSIVAHLGWIAASTSPGVFT